MDSSDKIFPKRNKMKKFSMGFIAILAGVVLLAFNFNILPGDFRHIIFSWQMLLIAIGVVSLAGNENRTPGVILISIGTFFLLPELVDFHVPFVKLFWPALLIVIGISLIFRKGFRPRSDRGAVPPFHRPEDRNLDEGYLNQANIFSGSKQRIFHQEFKGGKVTSIFGGSEIDLTQATLGEGRVELDVECLFGGVTIIVPSDWKVVLNISTILGGFTDKRALVRENPDSKGVLVIKGTAIFGGGEIKSY